MKKKLLFFGFMFCCLIPSSYAVPNSYTSILPRPSRVLDEYTILGNDRELKNYPFSEAAYYISSRNSQALKMILSEFNSHLTKYPQAMGSLLHYAYSDYQIINDDNEDENSQAKTDKKSAFKIIKHLIDLKKIKLDLIKDDEDHTVLALAAKDGNIEVLSLLVENGGNIEAKNIFGETPLILAANVRSSVSTLWRKRSLDFCKNLSKRHATCVDFLIKKKANMNAKDRFNRCLYHHYYADPTQTPNKWSPHVAQVLNKRKKMRPRLQTYPMYSAFH